MKVKIQISFILFSLLLCVNSHAQDSHFSQYEYSPLTVNPALTGIDKKLQVVLHHKDQWRALNGYRTDELSFEMRFNPSDFIKVNNKTAAFKGGQQKGFAFGVNLFSDKAGDGNLQTISGRLSLAYHLPLNENSRISAGIIGGVEQRSINPNGLRFNSQYGTNGTYDPSSSSGEIYTANKLTNGDFAAGLCYSYGEEDKYIAENNNKSFKIGAALDHISRPTQSYIAEANSVSYFKYTLHAQTLMGIANTSYSIKACIISMFEGKQTETALGAFFKYKMKETSKYTGIKKGMSISLGCYYRYRDAIIPSLQYEMARGAIGISYDINTSGLSKATIGRGGLEITMRFFNPVSFLYQKKD